MARIRSMKPEFRTSVVVTSWPRDVRLFFALLWGYCDDYGRGVDDPLLIKSDCFPRDEDLSPLDIDAWLEIIADSGPLCRYTVDGRNYLHCTGWSEHQKPQHPTRSKVPPCPDCDPDGHRTWREGNPPRPKSRSRAAREELMNSSGGHVRGPAAPPADTSAGAPPEALTNSSGEPPESAEPPPSAQESAGQDASGNPPETLTRISGDLHGIFTPELGSKGARERGARGRAQGPLSPGWQPSEQARLRAAADITRLGADGTTFVTHKLVQHGYTFRTAADADRMWVRWMAREDPKRNPAAVRQSVQPDAYRDVVARQAVLDAAPDTAPPRRLHAVPDTAAPVRAGAVHEAAAGIRQAMRARRDQTTQQLHDTA